MGEESFYGHVRLIPHSMKSKFSNIYVRGKTLKNTIRNRTVDFTLEANIRVSHSDGLITIHEQPL